MTVKSLSEDQKDRIVAFFTYRTTIYSQPKSAVINEMAILYERHRRTIIRALEERGVDPGVKTRIKKEPEQGHLPMAIRIRTKTPWYRRLFQSMGQTLGFIE